MELDLKKMTDRELLLILATHVVEKEPEVRRKILTSLLAEKLSDSAYTKLKSKLKSKREVDEIITGGYKLVATIDYGGEKICTSSDYVDGELQLNQHMENYEVFGKRLASAANALAEKIASTYNLERVENAEAVIQPKLRTAYGF